MIVDVASLKPNFCLACGPECCREGGFESDTPKPHRLINYKASRYTAHHEIIYCWREMDGVEDRKNSKAHVCGCELFFRDFVNVPQHQEFILFVIL